MTYYEPSFPPADLNLAIVEDTSRNGQEVPFINALGANLDLVKNELKTLEDHTRAGDFTITPPFKGTWSSATTYAKGDLVFYVDRTYISLQATNLNKQPDTQTAWWNPYTVGGTGPPGATGATGATLVPPFMQVGTLVLATGALKFVAWTALKIVGVYIYAGTAPLTNAIIADFNITPSGSTTRTTIFTNQSNRPTIAPSGHYSGFVTNMDVTTVNAGDSLSVDIDQVGASGHEGADLTAMFICTGGGDTTPVIDITTTTLTLDLTHAGARLKLKNAFGCTITIPTNASVAFPVDTIITLEPKGAGGASITNDGTTSPVCNKIAGFAMLQFGAYNLIQDSVDDWTAF